MCKKINVTDWNIQNLDDPGFESGFKNYITMKWILSAEFFI